MDWLGCSKRRIRLWGVSHGKSLAELSVLGWSGKNLAANSAAGATLICASNTPAGRRAIFTKLGGPVNSKIAVAEAVQRCGANADAAKLGGLTAVLASNVDAFKCLVAAVAVDAAPHQCRRKNQTAG